MVLLHCGEVIKNQAYLTADSFDTMFVCVYAVQHAHFYITLFIFKLEPLPFSDFLCPEL